ncbi:MAG TPA: SDR family NAD(P)-dependent oxidoreductase [Burkholderiaceae bacterium]|nr:SDR family NAD(P)-dependent oxidoreductase [Burkholderiaceae bacterium]
MNLAGRSVVITGGASGLGRATARLMALGHGARVALFDLPGSAGSTLAAELGQAGGRAAFVPVDVADEGSVPPRALKRMTDAMVFPRRFGDPAEFAAAVVHLCENAYLNGTTIRLDGAQRL